MTGAQHTHMLDRDELKELVKTAMREELELVGFDATDPDKRAEIRKDMEMIRTMRTAWDATSKKVGSAILWALIVGFGGIVALGFRAKFGQ